MTMQLYRHFDREGQLLYVGISFSAIARLAKHKKNCAPWLKRVCTITIETLPTRQKAMAAERRAIRAERPIFNVIHVRKEAA